MWCMTGYAGWLQDPDSRPPFNQLVKKFDEFTIDPLRYVLTTTDGCMSDYGLLPSNILRAGDCTYENPFTASGGFNSAETANGELGPYGNVFPRTEYQNRGFKSTLDEVRICAVD